MADKKDDQPVEKQAEQQDEQQVTPQEADTPVETTEEQTPETEEAEQPEAEAPPEETTEQPEEEKPPSRRESLRIQQLVEKLKAKEEKADTKEKPEPLDYREALDADDEVVSTLESDRQAYGQNQYNEGLAEARKIQFHTRLEIDAPRVEAKYPQLDKESDEFNPQVADAINSMYLGMVGFDPNTGNVANSEIRYRDYVDGIIELANAVAGEKVQQSRTNIARQAANTAVRPGGTANRLNLNKSPDQMTDEELNTVIDRAFKK